MKWLKMRVIKIVKVIHLNLYFQIKKQSYKDSDDSVKVQFGIIWGLIFTNYNNLLGVVCSISAKNLTNFEPPKVETQ